MYCTMPSGTRYQVGLPLATRARHSVDEIASAGTSSNVIRSIGSWSSGSSRPSVPGRVQPTNWASLNISSTSRQVRIWASASAPVMKNSSASGYSSDRSRRVSIVYVGPGRSMSTRLTENRGFDAVAITVIRYRSSAGETSRSSFCHGWPVGTKITSSRSKYACTSLAATKCP